MKETFKNYFVFYNMVLSATIMSNTASDEFDADAKRIIDFIGKAYKMDDDFISRCSQVILEELVSLGLTTDQQAVYSSREYGDKFTGKDVLFDIKGDVLSRLQKIGESERVDINKNWFDYSHYKTYDANVRFSKIYMASATGNLISTRQVGILKALGIGCEKDIDESAKRLTQCVFWGDIPSAYLLAYVYALSGDEKKSALYYEVAELVNKYLNSGYTVLPDEAKKTYSKDACTFYVYISSIKQDVVYAYNKASIDFSFIEAITSNKIDYFTRMSFINNYDMRDWKEVTNSSVKPSKRLGF